MWLSHEIKDWEYHERPSVSWSQLKEFIKSPRHFKAQFERKKGATPAMEYGSLLHLLALQPEEYLRRMVEDSTADRRTKDGKAEYQTFIEGLQEDSIIATHRYSTGDLKDLIGHRCKHGHIFKRDDIAEAFEMRNELWRHPQWLNEMVQCCEAEQNRIAFDQDIVVEIGGEVELEGIAWRIKPDLRSKERLTIWDYKTTESCSDDAIIKTMARFKYHYTAAFYLMIASAIDGVNYENFVWIFQEKTYPYVTRFVTMTHAQMMLAYMQVRQLMEQFIQTTAFGDWSAYAPETTEIQLPDWAFRLGDDL